MRGATGISPFSNTTQTFQSTHPVRGATLIGPTLISFWFPFQSTHPVRGATPDETQLRGIMLISIHAPREGCDLLNAADGLDHVRISIHAPREGCDPPLLTGLISLMVFQSTHPVRGATPRGIELQRRLVISIHAPREGCDRFTASIS